MFNWSIRVCWMVFLPQDRPGFDWFRWRWTIPSHPSSLHPIDIKTPFANCIDAWFFTNTNTNTPESSHTYMSSISLDEVKGGCYWWDGGWGRGRIDRGWDGSRHRHDLLWNLYIFRVCFGVLLFSVVLFFDNRWVFVLSPPPWATSSLLFAFLLHFDAISRRFASSNIWTGF